MGSAAGGRLPNGTLYKTTVHGLSYLTIITYRILRFIAVYSLLAYLCSKYARSLLM